MSPREVREQFYRIMLTATALAAAFTLGTLRAGGLL